ncbi:MAG: hypothetical protein PHF18_04915 [Methanosarcina sp.]|uniref:hypothetical protein n=1 Tax=Methanosarcina sp. TaxID=2213 RepID=UPI002630AD8E|nr:hypothetical protein [Methanosarcina sp.]MDD3246183.1 hypothetical protein [Methanosarcina sp.]
MDKTLRGLRNVCLAENLYYLEKVGMNLKKVKITLLLQRLQEAAAVRADFLPASG